MMKKGKTNGVYTAKEKPKKTVKKNSPVHDIMPMDNREWEKREDAQTLKRAMEIQSDPKRLNDALGYANKELEALKKVSNLKPKT